MQIDHDTAQNRFIAHLEEGDATLAYSKRGDGVLDLVHTQVPAASRGEGVGERLVEHVVAYAKDNGLRVVPSCPFVRHWLSEHPEHADVVADSQS